MGRKNVKSVDVSAARAKIEELKTQPVGEVPLLKSGAPATLGTFLEVCEALFGSDSGAVDYLKEKIAESPQGADEVILADENKINLLLAKLHDMKLHISGQGKVVPKVAD